ncbi:serine hydrolase domain-containing protein [Pseudonocardia humida]|uniref:Beta-lactamase family protein n=1 Tax=Pseudonocardia humida TaxID=2800819 RepID=A0ABT1A647_9PSEU|nr:serine hydrolase domain-containing protein [Pseudonocardia humida]MCO1658470.1 beta-lactamase family protein [Pseudonocardia humida]
MTTNEQVLAEFVEATAIEHGVPGLAVGVWADGQEVFACHGVTSVEDPLPVTPDTMFALGSVSKTATATAVLRLVVEGRLELDAPVRRHVPELVLADERAAATITVLQLLNHTAGLGWRLNADTGDGDDALAAHVARMGELELIAPPGTRASYSQEGYNLLGRVIEVVTGLTYERAVAELLFEPLGLAHSYYRPADVLTRRHTVGHEGTAVVRPLTDTRANGPGGGLVSSAADQLRWARFHLGDGAPILAAAMLRRMREPTVELRGSSLGDAFGLCWFLRDVDGVRTVGHGGSANGQFAELILVPERDFAVVSLVNGNPGGIPANRAVVRRVLDHHLGLVERDPEPLPYDGAGAREVVGRYATDILVLDVVDTGTGLTAAAYLKPEVRAASEVDLPADVPPAGLGLLPGPGGEFVITDGAMVGLRGYFQRDEHGAVVAAELAGRTHTRVRAGDPGGRT